MGLHWTFRDDHQAVLVARNLQSRARGWGGRHRQCKTNNVTSMKPEVRMAPGQVPASQGLRKGPFGEGTVTCVLKSRVELEKINREMSEVEGKQQRHKHRGVKSRSCWGVQTV